MRRRTLLRRGGLAGLLVLAGCTSPGSGAPDDTETTSGDDEPTETPNSGDEPTETPTELGTDEPDGSSDVTVGESTFEVTENVSGTQVDRAEVSFEAHSETVAVDGTIWGADGCKTATLDGVDYDESADELTVRVATVDREGTEDQMCTQAIVEISYEARVFFEGGLPSSATVVHDGRVAAEARRE